jgi:hypothetical protein
MIGDLSIKETYALDVIYKEHNYKLDFYISFSISINKLKPFYNPLVMSSIDSIFTISSIVLN